MLSLRVKSALRVTVVRDTSGCSQEQSETGGFHRNEQKTTTS